MRKVWKYEVTLSPTLMPFGAKIVHVGMQGHDPYLWAEVDPDAPTEDRHFVVVGTGQDIPESSVHVGTVLDRPFVWHVYELVVA